MINCNLTEPLLQLCVCVRVSFLRAPVRLCAFDGAQAAFNSTMQTLLRQSLALAAGLGLQGTSQVLPPGQLKPTFIASIDHLRA